MPRCVVVLATLLAAARTQARPFDYEAVGRAWLTELGEAEAPALPDLLARHFRRLPIGEFDLCVPEGMLAKGQDPARIPAIATALVDLQSRLAELTLTDAAALKAKKAELAQLRKEVGTWRAKPRPVDAAAGSRPQVCELVLAPDRRTFLGLTGWLGLWKPVYRERFWHDGTVRHCDMRLQDEGQVQIVALEYASPDPAADAFAGFDMNTRERTGLLQHVVQRAAMSWCWRAFGDTADATFVLGFVTDLVIDVLGQNNARSDGSGTGKTTEGVNAFIPGAPSRGGSMQMVNADSTWRLTQGQDWFARVLRQAQKAGEHAAEDNKDRLGHFQLRDPKGQKLHLVHAPFLGAVAYDRADVPPEFLDDYLEFHRAYRAGFVHWLQLKGMKAKASSLERFQQLLQRLMAQRDGERFEALCAELYGVPLSAKAADVDTLERRYLAWIAADSR
ncbi:MAG: hypothetical protein JNL08_02665 [Planctomycetes bacterium]|nr:hypothetical protein [Planctomycetota bacterium]